MSKITTFDDLDVWKKAHQFVLEIYRVTRKYPDEERFGLVSQIRRSAVSACANMAEGGKKSTKDFVRFLDIAQGSLEETKYHLILSRDLNYLSAEEYGKFAAQADEIGRMLHGLLRSLRSS